MQGLKPGLWEKLLWIACLPVRLAIRRVLGRERLPSSPCVLAASHGSFLDPVLISYACWDRHMRPLVSPKYCRFPFVTFLRLGDSIMIPKDMPGGAVDEAVRALKQGSSIILFPQGKRTGNKIIRPKSGAARMAIKAGVPIVPIKITNSHNILKLQRTDVIIGTPIIPKKNWDSPKQWDSLTTRIARDINALGNDK